MSTRSAGELFGKPLFSHAGAGLAPLLPVRGSNETQQLIDAGGLVVEAGV